MGGKIILNSVEYVGGDSPAIVDVNELPTNNISKDTFYRKSEDVYVYNQQELDPSTTVWYGDGMHGFIEVIDEAEFVAYNVVGDIVGDFFIDALTDQEVNSLLNADIIAVKDSLAESKFFGTPNFFGFSELVTIEKGNYKLFHNPTSSPGKYIEVGEGSLPAGGTTGQILTKTSGTDYDTEWVTPTTATGTLVTSISSASTDNEYPSAKCMWDIIGDVETLINAL
jgi:hypothetical protein